MEEFPIEMLRKCFSVGRRRDSGHEVSFSFAWAVTTFGIVLVLNGCDCVVDGVFYRSASSSKQGRMYR